MAREQMAENHEAGQAVRPLDPIDRTILRLLQEDGRASIRSVADRVHVSRANAYARINRLIEDGVIRGFAARVDHERAGQGTSAYITLKIVQNSWRTVREKLVTLPGVVHIALGVMRNNRTINRADVLKGLACGGVFAVDELAINWRSIAHFSL